MVVKGRAKKHENGERKREGERACAYARGKENNQETANGVRECATE